MATLSIEFDAEGDVFIEDLVRRGNYSSTEEFVRRAIGILAVGIQLEEMEGALVGCFPNGSTRPMKCISENKESNLDSTPIGPPEQEKPADGQTDDAPNEIVMLNIGIPKEHLERLENLAERTGVDDVYDLIEKALMFLQEAIECIEEGGHIFFRDSDGNIACVSGLAPHAEDPTKPIPPITPTSFGAGHSPKNATTLIEIIKRLGWSGLGLKILQEGNEK